MLTITRLTLNTSPTCIRIIVTRHSSALDIAFRISTDYTRYYYVMYK